MVMPNRLNYLRSLASELSVQSHRVRDLIGDAHWLSDGHHKEYLLLSLLQRHLPAGMIASRGFVVGHTDHTLCSKEQDILIVDTTGEGPLFNQGHLLIAFPHQVRAVISVKTTISAAMVTDAATGMASIYSTGFPYLTATPWFGIFFFEPCPCQHVTLAKYLTNATASSRALTHVPVDWQVDAFACSDDLLCLKRMHSQATGNPIAVLQAYQSQELSTALFFGHLMDHLAASRQSAESTFLSAMDDIQMQPLAEFNATFQAT
jgi:hypothetical protein